jgi:hypothetical protein
MPEIKTVTIDAGTYQDALGELAATMAQKLFREGQAHIAGLAQTSERS